MLAPWCLKLGESRKKKGGTEREKPCITRRFFRITVCDCHDNEFANKYVSSQETWQFPAVTRDAYNPSTTEWYLLISYNCVICTCWMYCRHLISNSFQHVHQPSCLRLPSVITSAIFRHLLTDYRKTGRAPKSSSKAIEYAFLNFDLDAGRIRICLSWC